MEPNDGMTEYDAEALFLRQVIRQLRITINLKGREKRVPFGHRMMLAS
jgi:hypothetical protein